MRQYALIKHDTGIYKEDFEVSSKEKAKDEILEYVRLFNKGIRNNSEKERELYSMPIRNKKVLYFADDSPEEEIYMVIIDPLVEKGILFDKIKCTDIPPFRKENYDILFFDWGGMSLGNSLMESFCREIIEEAKDYPNRMYVMVSLFTSSAMRDSLMEFGKDSELHNIFLDIDNFADKFEELA